MDFEVRRSCRPGGARYIAVVLIGRSSAGDRGVGLAATATKRSGPTP